MEDDAYITIDPHLTIPAAELSFRASRASGPGGQHVNTSATRVELTWNVRTSAALSEDQRQRLLQRLARRIDAQGILHLTASTRRSQLRNREEVTERFRDLVAKALRVPRRRKKTRPPPAAREARLRAKRRRARTKRERRPPAPDD